MSNAMLQRRGVGGSYPPSRAAPASGGIQIQSSTALAVPTSLASSYSAAGRITSTAVQQPITPSIQTSYTTALKGGAAAVTVSNSSSNSSNNSSNNENASHQSTQRSLAHAFLPDLPLLMHGSGDVLPENVNPHTVATLAKLVEKYVASLVSAAMDAHDVFTDGEVVGGGACLAPPPFSAAAGAGGDSDDDNNNNNDDDATHNKKRSKSSSPKSNKRKKKRRRIDYWDVPLPPPSEDNDGDSVNSSNDSDISDDDSDDDAPLVSPFRRQSSSASTSSIGAETSSALAGFAPVDLHANERVRNHYVAAPTVMDARSFIFPVCHDAGLYQRIKEVQASRRAIRGNVVDGALMEVMKEEGATIGRWGSVDMLDAVLGDSANGNDDGNEATGAEGDKKKGGGAGNKASDKDKSKSGDKSKDARSDSEKKSDNNDGANIVGAGLLDDADVDPSWPGLNSLLRGSLW